MGRYTIETRDNHTVIHLEGDLTLAEMADLREVFWQQLNEHKSKHLIIAMEEAGELHPATISLLVSTKNLADKHKATLTLAGLQVNHRRLLEKINLHQHFAIADSVAAALDDIAPL